MVLMTTKEIPYRLNPIGMVSSFARRQVASPFFTDCSVPTFLISLFPFYSSKSSIWRILNKYGVKLDRGQTSGPRVKQNPKEDGTNEGNS